MIIWALGLAIGPVAALLDRRTGAILQKTLILLFSRSPAGFGGGGHPNEPITRWPVPLNS
jgi:hypothetical protein